jgi:hypothetical protein
MLFEETMPSDRSMVATAHALGELPAADVAWVSPPVRQTGPTTAGRS